MNSLQMLPVSWFTKLRLRYGIFWYNQYPTPHDYKQETRFISAIFLILFMLWLFSSRMDFESALVQEELAKESYQAVVLACANQANNGGTIGVVFDGKLYGVECQILSREPYKNLKRM